MRFLASPLGQAVTAVILSDAGLLVSGEPITESAADAAANATLAAARAGALSRPSEVPGRERHSR